MQVLIISYRKKTQSINHNAWSGSTLRPEQILTTNDAELKPVLQIRNKPLMRQIRIEAFV